MIYKYIYFLFSFCIFIAKNNDLAVYNWFFDNKFQQNHAICCVFYTLPTKFCKHAENIDKIARKC